MYNASRLVLKGALAVALSSVAGLATPITGNLAISGSAEVSNTFVNFLCSSISGIGCNPATQGNFLAGSIQSGDFTAVAESWGWIKDINAAGQPVGSAFLLTDFITFAAAPNLHLDLEFIAPGDFSSVQCTAAPAGGQTCTPTLPSGTSAFNLVNFTDAFGNINSTATFQVNGRAYSDTVATGFSTFTGTFSADFNSPYQTVLTQLATQGTIAAPYSARFQATAGEPIPEPGTTSLVVAGFAALAFARFRRSRQ